MNLRTKNLVIPMDQRIDQHLTNGLIRVVTAFFTGHTTDTPRVFAVVANKIFRILQQRDQTCTLKFLVIQSIFFNAALVVAFPARAENTGLFQNALIAKQQAAIRDLSIICYQSCGGQVFFKVEILFFQILKRRGQQCKTDITHSIRTGQGIKGLVHTL